MKILAAVFVFGFAVLINAQTVDQSYKEKNLLQKAREIHNEILSIDSHTDTPLNLTDEEFDLSKSHELKSGYRIDLPRMKKGKIDGAFFAVFTAQGERTDAGNEKAKEHAFNILKLIHQKIEENKSLAEIAYTPDDAYRIKKDGKRVIFIGMENGYPIGEDISLIQKYYDLGTRYITLCHTKDNDICGSSNDDSGDDGLSEFGKKVVSEMNRLGIMVDISHASDKSVSDVLNYSKAPVIASHSCAKAICDNPRNLPDSLIKRIAEKGGVVQVCIFSGYVKNIKPSPERKEAMDKFDKKYSDYAKMTKEERAKARAERHEINEKYPMELATVSDFVDHIDHIVKLVGVDYVGIGTDFDGGGGLKDCRDVSEMINITEELLKRGYTKEDLRKIWGANLMRVLKKVQEEAEI